MQTHINTNGGALMYIYRVIPQMKGLSRVILMQVKWDKKLTIPTV